MEMKPLSRARPVSPSQGAALACVHHRHSSNGMGVPPPSKTSCPFLTSATLENSCRATPWSRSTRRKVRRAKALCCAMTSPAVQTATSTRGPPAAAASAPRFRRCSRARATSTPPAPPPTTTTRGARDWRCAARANRACQRATKPETGFTPVVCSAEPGTSSRAGVDPISIEIRSYAIGGRPRRCSCRASGSSPDASATTRLAPAQRARGARSMWHSSAE